MLELKGKALPSDIMAIIRKYDLSGISEEPPIAAKQKVRLPFLFGLVYIVLTSAVYLIYVFVEINDTNQR